MGLFDKAKESVQGQVQYNQQVKSSLTPSVPKAPVVPAVTPGSKKEKEEQRKAIVKNSWLENYNLSLPGIGRAYAQANPQIAQNAVDETNMFINEKLDNPMERFAFGAFDKINPAGSSLNNLERTVGDIDTEKLDKSIAYQAGNMAGYMGQYALSGGLGIESAVFNGMKALPRVAGMGKIASPLLRGVTSNAVGGLPINVTTSLDESVQDGKVDGGQFAKSMAINTAIDTVLGGAVEGISALARLRRYSKAKQDEVIEKVAKQLQLPVAEVKLLTGPVRGQADFFGSATGLSKNIDEADVRQLPAPTDAPVKTSNATTKPLAKKVDSDFYTNPGGQTAKDIQTADIKGLPEPKAETKSRTNVFAYVDKPGVDKVKAKSDAYRAIKEATGIKDGEGNKVLTEALRKIDTNEKDGWDTPEFWNDIMDVMKKQEHSKVDPEETFPGLKKEIRETKIRISDDLKQMVDFNDLRKKSMGKVTLSKKGRPIDELYGEWSEMHPGLFPDSITHPTAQLEKILEVSDSLKPTTKTIGDVMSDDDLWDGPLTQVWKAINDYRRTVKEDVSYGKGQKEVPTTATRGELSGDVKARTLPTKAKPKKELPKRLPKKEADIYAGAKGQKEVPKTVVSSEMAGNTPKSAVQPPKAESRPVAPPKKETPKTEPKMEVKNAESKRDTVPTETRKLDPKTERVLEKLNNRLRERGEEGERFYEAVKHPRQKEIDVLADLFKAKVVTVKPLKETADTFHGVYVDDTIVINLSKTSNPAHVIFGHEVLHQVRAKHSAEYDRFAKVFAKSLDESKVKRYKESLEQAEGKMTDDAMLEEMIADFSGEMFNDPKIMRRIFEEDRTVAQWIHDIITGMITKIKDSYVLSTSLKDLKAVQDEYVKLMREARLKDARPDKPGMKFSTKPEKAMPSEKIMLNRLKTDDKLDGYNSKKEVLENAEKLLLFVKEKEHQISLSEYLPYAGLQGTGGKISRIGNLGEIRTVAKAITTDLINYGKVDLRGKRVETSKDLALICQVYRDPRFETIRYFYAKEGVVVGHEGVTCKIPGMSRVAPGNYKEDPKVHYKYFDEIKDRMKKLGADSIYVVHNHPSGNPEPSLEDINVTTAMANIFGDAFSGHVVIDSNKYAFISKYGITSTHDLNLGEDLVLKPSIAHTANGKKVNSPDLLADLAKQLQVSEDVSSLVYVDAKLNVRALQEVPNNSILSGDKSIEQYISEKLVDFGSTKAFLIYSKKDKAFLGRVDDMMRSGHTLDAVDIDTGYSHRANGSYPLKEVPDGVNTHIAESVDVKFSTKRDSDGKLLTKEQDAFFKDSKVRDADGNLLKLYHGTTRKFTTFKEGTAPGWGRGIYLTDNRETALDYGESVMEVYADLRNPYMSDTQGVIDISKTEAYQKHSRKIAEREADDLGWTVEEYLEEYPDPVDRYELWEENFDVVNEALREMGYDGIIATNSNDVHGLEVVVFGENKVKSVDNLNPTKDPDIRFSKKRGMESGLHRERVKKELQDSPEYQEIIKELEDVILNDDPIIEHIAKRIKDHSGLTMDLKDVYRNMRDAFGKDFDIIKEKYLDPFDASKKQYVDTMKKYTDIVYKEVTKDLKIRKGSKESSAVQWIGEGKRQMGWEWKIDDATGKKYKTIKLVDYSLDDLKKDFPNRWQDIKKASEKMRELYDDLIDEVNESRRKIYPNSPEKLVPKRKDYFRHYREMSSSFQGLWNVFASSTNIDPKLAGISEFTQPKSKWASYMQQRGMGKYKEDAIGGFLDYIGPASYSINIDPHINQFRNLAKQIAEATVDTKNANNTIAFLHDFANSLAGKTVDWDRLFVKKVGRKPLIALSMLNNRVKKNQILMNFRSALSQVANVPLGIAKIKNPVSLTKGVGDAITSIAGLNPKVQGLYNRSQFISERYSRNLLDRFDNRWIDQPEKLAGWLLEGADQLGTKFIWNSAYHNAVDKGIANPIKYADDLTRALVAGRGIGEVPLLQQSKVFQMIAPFQLEVTNLWHVFGDMRKEKDFGGILLILLGNYLFNNAYEEAVGDRVVFDPIDAVAQSIKDGNTAYQTGARLAGEMLSNIPLGQTFASVYPEYGMEITIPGTEKKVVDLPSRKELFGDNDPTRYGSGILLTKAVQDPLYRLLPPMGGSQIKKTVEAVSSLKKGEVSKDGKINYLVEKKPENMVKGALFGKYAFDEAKTYTERDRRPLTEKQSEAVRTSKDPEKAYEKTMIDRRMNTLNDKIKDVKKDDTLTEAEQKKEIVKILKEQITEVKETTLYTEAEKRKKILDLQGKILKYQK